MTQLVHLSFVVLKYFSLLRVYATILSQFTVIIQKTALLVAKGKYLVAIATKPPNLSSAG